MQQPEQPAVSGGTGQAQEALKHRRPAYARTLPLRPQQVGARRRAAGALPVLPLRRRVPPRVGDNAPDSRRRS